MAYILQAVSANGVAVVMLITLMLTFRRKYHIGRAEWRTFFLMMVVNIFQCVAETLTILLDARQFPGAVAVSVVLNTLLFLGNIVFAVLWMSYADQRRFSRGGKRGRWFYAKYIPAALVVLGLLVNLFTPVFFRITPDNVYHRTSVGFPVVFLCTYFYLIVGAWVAYGVTRRSDGYVFLPAITFLAPVVLATALQMLFPGISLLWAGAAVGLNAGYVSLLDEGSAIDPLSGAYNRHYLNRCLDSQLSAAAKKPLAGIMLDIDDFKSINDTYGHVVGDDAITQTGRILLRLFSRRALVFRFAGDEFVILLSVEDREQLLRVEQEIRAAFAQASDQHHWPYRLSAAVGGALYRPGSSVTEFLAAMDAAMYRDKGRALSGE